MKIALYALLLSVGSFAMAPMVEANGKPGKGDWAFCELEEFQGTRYCK